MIRLTIRNAEGEERAVSIDGDEVIFGKQADCHVPLPDGRVSRRHARLVVADGRMFVEDLGSTNGTAVGGRAVEGRTAVGEEDEIRIGPFTVRAEIREAESTALTPRPAPATDSPYGPLGVFFADDAVSEIMVNGPNEVFVERGGRIELTQARFASEAELRELVGRIASDVGRTIDDRRPILDARLSDGSRANAVLPPLAIHGPYLTIRRFPRERPAAAQLVELGSISRPMIEFLGTAVGGRLNLLVSGGTGSGKTTLLNALCAFFGSAERVVTIEDAAELKLPQRHVLPLETRPPDLRGENEVTVRDLVRNALRMRPDRIVVGEVRGGEALDMLQAMNTGHDGSLCTIHANSPREAITRLETLALFAGTDLPPRLIREQIVGAIRLVVHVARTADGRRRVTSISELTGMEGEQFTSGEIFRFETGSGEKAGFRATGYVPRCRDILAARGVKIDNTWFQ